MKKLINYINKTIKEQKQIITFIIIIFLIGLLIGSLFINFVSKDDKALLINQINTFFNNVKDLSNNVFGVNAFKDTVFNNYIQLLIIYVLGISMVGVLLVIIIMFFKGFTLGVTLSSIILKYGIKGAIASLLYVFPAMILNILIYVFACFFAVYASILFLKALIKKRELDFKKFLGKYLLSFIISIILMFISCFLEAFLMPLLLKLFTFII